jgi:hypothetical protein
MNADQNKADFMGLHLRLRPQWKRVTFKKLLSEIRIHPRPVLLYGVGGRTRPHEDCLPGIVEGQVCESRPPPEMQPP